MMETQLLFKPGEMPMKPRPNEHDGAIIKTAIIDKLLPDVIEWYGKEWQESERDAVIEDLMEARDDDGFRFAYELSRHHYWECDFQLAEILDNFSVCLAEAHDHALREWVAAAGMTPKLAIGAEVNVKLAGHPVSGQPGTIVRVDTARGEYKVTVPGTGQTWDSDRQLGSYYPIAWEKLEAYNK